MKLALGILALSLLGCQGPPLALESATPSASPALMVPRTQSQNRPETGRQLAEMSRQTLPIDVSASPAQRQTLMIGEVPPAVVTRRPTVEQPASYPQYQPRQVQPSRVAALSSSHDLPQAARPATDFSSVNINKFLGLNSHSSCAVVLLVDVSGSVFQRGVEIAVDAAAKVYARQSPSDRIWVIPFGSQPEMVVNGHGARLSRQQLGHALIHSRVANSGTALAPAIQMANSVLANSHQDRRVVIVSDGALQDANVAVLEARQSCQRRNVSFSTIGIGNDWSGAAVLKEIADQTGGAFVNTY